MHGKPGIYAVGVSAFLAPGGSVHRETFVHAVQIAVKHYSDVTGRSIRLCWQNDDAGFEGGRQAAQNLVKRKVRMVIGHYATAAAAGALPVYREAGIPLLLPAATADHLTASFENAFRICRSDSGLAAYICNMICHISKASRVAVAHDDSMHGRYLSQALMAALVERNQLGDLAGRHDAVVFAGMFGNSMAFLREYRSREPLCPLYFTDDAVHADIVKDALGFERNLYIAGYAPAYWYPHARTLIDEYRNLWNACPSTYFLETYAAMQIALACKEFPEDKLMQALNIKEWPTVLGTLRFVNRESNCSRFAIWHISGEHGLQPLQNLPAYA